MGKYYIQEAYHMGILMLTIRGLMDFTAQTSLRRILLIWEALYWHIGLKCIVIRSNLLRSKRQIMKQSKQ
jgi:hypothetical protein